LSLPPLPPSRGDGGGGSGGGGGGGGGAPASPRPLRPTTTTTVTSSLFATYAVRPPGARAPASAVVASPCAGAAAARSLVAATGVVAGGFTRVRGAGAGRLRPASLVGLEQLGAALPARDLVPAEEVGEEGAAAEARVGGV